MPSIEPLNVTAQMAHTARGNPPSTLPASAVSNCFPGLEFDFRNVWKFVFEGIEMREAGWVDGHLVMDVESESAADSAGVSVGDQLVNVDERSLELPITGSDGSVFVENAAWEFSNAFAHIVQKGGMVVPCVFRKSNGTLITAQLTVREIFDGVALAAELAEPGAMTQGLCSPWQADYRECGCFYWAASRPDFVNVENNGGNAEGHDWMQKDRSPGTPYQPDPGGRGSADHISYDDLYTEWESQLKFVIDGKDEG